MVIIQGYVNNIMVNNQGIFNTTTVDNQGILNVFMVLIQGYFTSFMVKNQGYSIFFNLDANLLKCHSLDSKPGRKDAAGQIPHIKGDAMGALSSGMAHIREPRRITAFISAVFNMRPPASTTRGSDALRKSLKN